MRGVIDVMSFGVFCGVGRAGSPRRRMLLKEALRVQQASKKKDVCRVLP
jgi:hypothetical protein